MSLGARVSDGYDEELTDTATPPMTGVRVGRGEEGVESYLIDQRDSACRTRSRGWCVAVARRTQQVPNTAPMRTVHVHGPYQSFTVGGNQFTGTGIAEFTVRTEKRIGDSWLVRVSQRNDRGPFRLLANNAYREDIELLFQLRISNGCRVLAWGSYIKKVLLSF